MCENEAYALDSMKGTQNQNKGSTVPGFLLCSHSEYAIA
jgi:hypothetical protein